MMKHLLVILTTALFSFASCTEVQGGRTSQRKRITEEKEEPIMAMAERDTSINTITSDTLNYEQSEGEYQDTVHIGSFTIPAITNPSTGFDWKVKIESDSSAVALDTIITAPTKTPVIMMGAPTLKRYIFKARESGYATIIFTYERVWEGKEEPVSKITYRIKIEE